jgi:cell filamentation protein
MVNHCPADLRRPSESPDLRVSIKGLDKAIFAKKAAHFLAELNAIHPFREGNGRTQLSFLAILADQAGHPFDMDKLKPDAMLKATIASFEKDEGPLVGAISKLIGVG